MSEGPDPESGRSRWPSIDLRPEGAPGADPAGTEGATSIGNPVTDADVALPGDAGQAGGPAGGQAGGGGGRGGRKGGLAGAAVGTSLANAVLPVSALLTGPVLARALGPEGRGIMVAVLAPVFVLQFVANLGLPEATTYAVARLRIPQRRAVYVVGRLAVLYGVLAALAVILLAPALMHRTPEAITPLRVAICALPLLMLTIIIRFATVGSRNFKLSNTERVFSSTTRLLAIVGFASLGWLTAPSAIGINIGTTLLGGFFLAYVTFRRTGRLTGSGSGARRRRGRRAPAFAAGQVPTSKPEVPTTAAGEASPARWADNKVLSRHLMGYGFRGAGGVLANLVNWRLDQAIMVVLVDARQLGLYAVAVSLAEIPSTVFGQLKNVLFAEASARDDLSVVARATRVILLMVTVVAILGVLIAPEAITLLFGDEFRDSIGMAQILFVGTIFFSAEQVVASGLLSLGFPGRRSVAQITAACITLIGLFVLTPHLGAVGAAWTSLAAYFANFVITTALFVRVTGIPARLVLFVRPADLVWLGQQGGRLGRTLRRKVLKRG